ncbi:PEGA domain-containing protein [Salinimicrobium sp. MT39]|uniref:PEGA domain-containing protein n=1 Tax=Salinimicrobium profundisediminis TaxID=2994553 RepID=A0A9X3CW89_9FLAO|nr:PEGA domain-containing protein [Salinimicrobium profundisediminis]MCX2837805.1 PEGA domain-containing protein [Salinimicrobium profundisediminis]
MKRILLSVFAVLFIGMTFTSCATLFGKKSHPLALSSEPDGAEVYVNGFKMGVTPVELNLKADKSYTIEFRKNGFDSVTRVVNTKVGAGWVVLDVLGGVIPVVIDAATGNWNKLDQDAVNAALVQQKEIAGTK